MHRIKRVPGVLGIVLSIGALLAPAVSAAPEVAAPDQVTAAAPPSKTFTAAEVWLRQCASFDCGYHVLPAGTAVWVYCYTNHAGLTWNVARTEWDIAGHLDASAVQAPNRTQSCDNAGTKRWAWTELWAHSCPAMGCGYGVVPPGHDIADLSGSSVLSEGYYWSLIIDHDNAHKNLVGWVHTEDID